MPVVPFAPKFMKIGVLTAALQELTPRAVRDPDPDRAIEDWAAFAREVGADYMQLSAALHPSESDVPAEAMLDPVANTLDLRQPFDKDRAKRVQQALEANKIGLSDIGYFDNMLHDDPAIRRKKHDFMRRASSRPRASSGWTRSAASWAATRPSPWTRTSRTSRRASSRSSRKPRSAG